MRYFYLFFMLVLVGCPNKEISWDELLTSSAWEYTEPGGAKFRVDFSNEAWDGGAFGAHNRTAKIKGLTPGWLGYFEERWFLELKDEQPVLNLSREQLELQKYLLKERGADYFTVQLLDENDNPIGTPLRFNQIPNLSESEWEAANTRLLGHWQLNGSEELIDTLKPAPLLLPPGMDQLHADIPGMEDYELDFVTNQTLTIKIQSDGKISVENSGQSLRSGQWNLSKDGGVIESTITEGPIMIQSSMEESLILDLRTFFKIEERTYDMRTFRCRFTKVRS